MDRTAAPANRGPAAPYGQPGRSFMPQNQTMYVYHSISGGQGFQGPLGPPPRMNPSAPGQQLPPQPPQPQQQQQLSGASGPALMAAIQAMQAAAAAQGRPPLGAPTYSAPMGQPGMRPHAPVAPQPNMTHSAVPDYPARSRQQQQHPQHVPPQACPPGSNEGHQALLQQLQAALSAPQGPASHAGGQQQQHHHQQQQPQQQHAAGPSTNSQQQTMGQPAGGNTWQQHPRLSVSKDEALNAEKQQAARMREQPMNRNTQLLQQMQQQHSQHRRQRAPPPSMLPPPQQRQQQHAPHVLHPAGSSAGALGSIPAQQGSWGRQGMGAGALARSSPSSNTSSHPEVPDTAGAGAVGAGARVESPAEAAAAAAAAGPGAALSTQQQQLLKGMLSATAIAAGAGGADRGSSHGGWDAAAATDQGGLGRSRSREAGGSQQGAAVLQQGGELSTLQPHVSSSHAGQAGPQQQQQTPVAAQLEQLQQLLQANMQQQQGPRQQQAHQQHQQQEDDAEEITPEVLTLLTMLAASAVYSAAESSASGRPMHPAVNARVLAASKRFLSALVSCDDNASPSDNLAATAAEPDAAAVTTRTSSGILQGEGLGTADAAAADAAAALCALPDLRGGIERSSGSGTLQQRRQRGSDGVEGEGDLEEGRASRRKRARFTSKVDALIAARGGLPPTGAGRGGRGGPGSRKPQSSGGRSSLKAT